MVYAETRRLAATMFTDIVGFSRQMGADEARMLRLLDVHNGVIQQTVTEYHGHIIKTVGDAFLVDFPSVVHAVQCAQQIQAQLRAHNAEKDKAEQIHVRIGIHLGDIVQRDGDVFGDGVNIASRLQPELRAADGHLAGVGTAYAVAGRYAEAQASLQRYLSRYPNTLHIHLMLAVVYSELGQAAEARAEAAEVLRINPKFSLEVHKQRMPIKDPAVLERHIAALRKAGLK
jgi:tetratricopeptide (TPR) repeat protein